MKKEENLKIGNGIVSQLSARDYYKSITLKEIEDSLESITKTFIPKRNQCIFIGNPGKTYKERRIFNKHYNGSWESYMEAIELLDIRRKNIKKEKHLLKNIEKFRKESRKRTRYK